MNTTAAPEPTTAQLYQIFIKAAPEAIWDAVTKPEYSELYFFGSRVETTGEVGTPFRYHSPDGSSLWADESVFESKRPRRLVTGWRSLYDPDLVDEPSSRVSWEIEPQDGGFTLVTLAHDRLENSPGTAANVAGVGWMMVLSGLKSVLETGSGLTAS